jgi:restriction system protein
MHQNEVTIAFGIVLEEIENSIAALNLEGAGAFQSGKYEVARELMDKGSQMTAFREKVNELQKEWENIFAVVTRGKVRKKSKLLSARLKRGLKTPDDKFQIPILSVLMDMGGSAPMARVLDKVGDKMKGQLNTYDYRPVPSDPSQTRWRNTAQWARKAMVKEGLLSSNSPWGVWEITDAGRKWLATHSAGQKLPHI